MIKTLVLALAAAISVTSAQAATLQKWQTKALKQVKAEKTVIDARWRAPESNVLWVAMQPDGGSRNGFAEYLCMVLSDNGAPAGELKTIFIYDPAAYKAGGSAMGIAACR